jgi:hypothetical protein
MFQYSFNLSRFSFLDFYHDEKQIFLSYTRGKKSHYWSKKGSSSARVQRSPYTDLFMGKTIVKISGGKNRSSLMKFILHSVHLNNIHCSFLGLLSELCLTR